MLEDALTSTRALHRLLLAASAVALVFVFSLAEVRSERGLLRDLQDLRALPVAAYETFVKEKIAASVTPSMEISAQQLGKEIERQLSSAGLQIFGANSIADAFRKPVHVGRLYSEQLILRDANATVDQIDRAFIELPIDRDVQIVQGDPSGLIPQIVDFLSQGTAGGVLGPAVARIENVQVHLEEGAPEIGDSFLPEGTSPVVLLTFELRRDGGGAPIFEGRFPVRVQTLADSSWREWLNQQAGSSNLFTEVGGRLCWLGQHSLSPKLRNQPLGALENDLVKKVEAAQASNRTIDLPGVSVPGSLALFAIPVVLLGLAASLFHHLDHLYRLAPDHRETFAQFAWTPLTMARSWDWETAVTVALLPALIQGLLAWRYDAFELPASLVLAVGLAGAVGSIVIGRRVIQRLADIRNVVRSPEP